MNNDLISREALKKEIKNSVPYVEQERILDIIDSSPTVEVGYLTNCANCERVEKIRAKRPHGKWIDREAVSNTTFPFWERYECNKCHKYNGYSNYCPNCGAKMEGGEDATA